MLNDEGWEERMAQRARARRQAEVAASYEASGAVIHRSAEEVWAARPDECRECYEARSYPPGQEHFGWGLWLICNRLGNRWGQERCQHAHHDDDLWLASA